MGSHEILATHLNQRRNMSSLLKEFCIQYKGAEYTYNRMAMIWLVNDKPVSPRSIPKELKNVREQFTDVVSNEL